MGTGQPSCHDELIRERVSGPITDTIPLNVGISGLEVAEGALVAAGVRGVEVGLGLGVIVGVEVLANARGGLGCGVFVLVAEGRRVRARMGLGVLVAVGGRVGATVVFAAAVAVRSGFRVGAVVASEVAFEPACSVRTVGEGRDTTVPRDVGMDPVRAGEEGMPTRSLTQAAARVVVSAAAARAVRPNARPRP